MHTFLNPYNGNYEVKKGYDQEPCLEGGVVKGDSGRETDAKLGADSVTELYGAQRVQPR